MRHLKVTFRPEAVKDISTVFHYIHELSGSAVIARGFVQRIRDRCVCIGNIPHGGRPRDDLAEGSRVVPFERSTVIAYTVTDKTVAKRQPPHPLQSVANCHIDVL